MSIIYDALKKTQENREENTQAPAPKKIQTKTRWTLERNMIMGGLLLVGLSLIYMSLVVVKSSPPPVVAVTKKTIKTPHLTLNGVITSDQTKIAIINNQSYKIGDEIHHMKIVAIEPGRVRLKNDEGTFVLRMAVV